MGLFDSLKKKAPAVQEAAPKEQEKKRIVYHVNLPAKSIRTDVTDDEGGSYFKGCHLWQEGNKVRAFQGSDVLFEVTDRSKAFKELEPLVGRELQHIILRKKTGEYGLYYLASIAIDE